MAEDEPKPFDAGDEKQVRKRKTKAQLAREREVEELRVLLKTKPGRDLLWRVLSQCKIYTFDFLPDGNQLYFDHGKRSIGGWLLQEVFTADAGAYTLMQSEAKEATQKFLGNGERDD